MITITSREFINAAGASLVIFEIDDVEIGAMIQTRATDASFEDASFEVTSYAFEDDQAKANQVLWGKIRGGARTGHVFSKDEAITWLHKNRARAAIPTDNPPGKYEPSGRNRGWNLRLIYASVHHAGINDFDTCMRWVSRHSDAWVDHAATQVAIAYGLDVPAFEHPAAAANHLEDEWSAMGVGGLSNEQSCADAEWNRRKMMRNVATWR